MLLFLAIIGLVTAVWVASFFFELSKGVRNAAHAVQAVNVALFLLVTIFNSYYIVDGGNRGIVSTLGAIQMKELEEGLNWVNPYTDSVDQWDVRVAKSTTKSSTFSSDMQTIETESTLNYHPKPNMVAELKQSVGSDYADRIIAPVVQEALKAVTAKYSIQQLAAERNTVRDQAKDLIVQKLAPYGIVIDNYAITNFNFSDKFEAAIEQKQVAEQAAEKAKFDLEKVKTDAQQAIARAEAEAAGLKAQKEQITPELLKLRQIEVEKIKWERWDGVLPRTLMDSKTPVMMNMPND